MQIHLATEVDYGTQRWQFVFLVMFLPKMTQYNKNLSNHDALKQVKRAITVTRTITVSTYVIYLIFRHEEALIYDSNFLSIL